MESIWNQVLKDRNEDKNKDIESPIFYVNLPLNEIKNRDIAFQIYSEYLNDHFWICSNNAMVEKIKEDDPTSVIYLISEIEKINKIRPDNESLRSIHEAKKVFGHSKLIEIN